MGFSWSTINVGELVKASHLNEIYDAVNTVTSALGVATFNWQIFPTSPGQTVSWEVFDELRDAIDYAYDNNLCSAHNAGYDVTIDANDYVTVDSVDYGSDDSAADSGYDSNFDSTIDGTDRVSYYSDHDSGVDSTYNVSVRDGDNSGYNSSEKGDYNSVEFGNYG